MLKNLTLSLACAASAAWSSLAAPLDRSKVAEDSKWVLHLDLDAFRKSRMGAHVVDKMLQPKLDEVKKGKKLDISLNLQNISGVTLYGPSFEKQGEGVLLLSTTANVKNDLDTLVGMAALSEKETKDVTMLQQNPYALYSLKDEIFVAPVVGNLVLVAKSKDQIEQARKVLSGASKSLAADSFADYPKTDESFFFLAFAEGLNESKHIPPQAQVLREAKGGRLVLGEKADNLFLNLVFKGKNDESSLKIQQVLQGIVALVSLSQQDKEVLDLASQTKIASSGRNVSIDLQFPVKAAIQKVEEKHGIHSDDEAEEEVPAAEVK